MLNKKNISENIENCIFVGHNVWKLEVRSWLEVRRFDDSEANKEQRTNLCSSVKINLCPSVQEKHNPQIHTDAIHR